MISFRVNRNKLRQETFPGLRTCDVNEMSLGAMGSSVCSCLAASVSVTLRLVGQQPISGAITLSVAAILPPSTVSVFSAFQDLNCLKLHPSLGTKWNVSCKWEKLKTNKNCHSRLHYTKHAVQVVHKATHPHRSLNYPELASHTPLCFLFPDCSSKILKSSVIQDTAASVMSKQSRSSTHSHLCTRGLHSAEGHAESNNHSNIVAICIHDGSCSPH